MSFLSKCESAGREDRRLLSIIGGLGQLGTSESIELGRRLNQCRHARNESRGDVTSALRWSYRCRTAACWRCKPSLIRAQSKRVENVFQSKVNEDCSFVTVCIARTTDLNCLGDLFRSTRKSIRNLRDKYARSDRLWNLLEIRGVIEVDAVSDSDIINLPPKRRTLISLLPVVGYSIENVVWLPHAHLCIYHPGITRSSLYAVFADKWPGENRVHVEEFYEIPKISYIEAVHVEATNVAANASTLISYALKLQPLSRFRGGFEEMWSFDWQARYHSWLFSQHRGLQTLLIKLNCPHSKS